MKHKNTLLLGIMILLVLSISAYAIPTDNRVTMGRLGFPLNASTQGILLGNQTEDALFRSARNDTALYPGVFWTASGAPRGNASCPELSALNDKSCIDFNGVGGAAYLSRTYGTVNFTNFSISISTWVYPASNPGANNRYIFSKQPTPAGRVYALFLGSGNGVIHLGAGSNPDIGDCGAQLQTPNNWFHIIVVWNNTGNSGAGRVSCYINGTLMANYTYTGLNDFNEDFEWGQNPTDGDNFRGFMRDMVIFNTTLNSSQIALLSDTTPAPAPVVYATINFTNIVNGTNINEVNITLANSTNSWNFSTTNGTINLFTNITYSAGFYNLTAQIKDHYNYFSQDNNFTQYNVFQIGQGKLDINLRKIITRTEMYNFTVINNLFRNTSVEQGSPLDVTVFVNFGGPNELNISGFNFTSFKVNYTLASLLDNASITYNVSDRRFNFTARDSVTNAALNNFTVNLENSTYNFTINLTSPFGPGASILVDLENITIYGNAQAPNYSTVNVSFLANNQVNYTNHTIFMTKSLSLNLTVYYEPTRLQLLNGTINIQVIGDTYSNNFSIFNSSGNSTLFIDTIPAGAYELRTSSDGFQERSKYIILSSTTYSNAQIFLHDNANTTEITFTITDQFANNLPNATIKALRYYNDLGTGLAGGFIEVEATKTNLVGQAVMHLERPNVFYKFLIEYDGRVLYEASATELITTTYSFQVSTTGSIVNSLIALHSTIWANISFINQTSPNYFRGTFTTPTGLTRFACLRVEQQKITGNTLIGESCLSASSGTIVIYINESDQANYVSQMYLDTTYTASTVPIASLAISLLEDFKTFGRQGIFYAFIFIGILVTVGAFNPVFGIVMAILGLIITFLAGITVYTGAILILLVVTGLILASRLKS